jgi:voltage-dependent calcium channel alpha-2/delta-3
VNVLASVDHSNDIMEGEPNAISVPNVKESGGNSCDKKPSKKIHRKMKKDSSSKNYITSSLKKVLWPRAPLSSALRLGLSVLVIITFIFGLTQLQNGEGQLDNQDSVHQKKMPNDQIKNWATSFGMTLWNTAKVATRFEQLGKSFSGGATTKKVDGFRMVQTMAASIEAMMQHKIDAIKRIMENAEEASLGHKYDKNLGERLKMKIEDNGYHYFNAKKINILDEDSDDGESYWERALSAIDREPNDKRNQVGFTRIILESNKHFSGIPVNVNYSSVHVPTNVYDGDPKVVNAIKWSKMLDDIFKDNYKRDPSLSWQYFGSSTGFMRQYPAMKWRTDEHDPDLYDARMRDWYIKSAASPKEIVILLDTSGSITGLRKEIAKHVVGNILETLSEDDFVTIYSFSKTPRPLVKCFSHDVDGENRAELVQATPENLREFQEAVTKVKTEEIANFTSALTVAF